MTAPPDRTLFGTDGVRGVANRDLTPELALCIGRALGAAEALGERELAARTAVDLGRALMQLGEAETAAEQGFIGERVDTTGLNAEQVAEKIWGKVNGETA